ncbi:unnamed protein product [Effrenium voratum]|nr:unnamed protein product [Effrenium voratum]
MTSSIPVPSADFVHHGAAPAECPYDPFSTWTAPSFALPVQPWVAAVQGGRVADRGLRTMRGGEARKAAEETPRRLRRKPALTQSAVQGSERSLARTLCGR